MKITPLDVLCTTCFASPGQPCRAIYPPPMRGKTCAPHPARVEKAQRHGFVLLNNEENRMTPDVPPAIDMPSAPATPDPLAAVFDDAPTDAGEKEKLLGYTLTCPCGHAMTVGVPPAELRTPDPRRFAVALTSQLGTMLAQHTSTLADVLAAYDRVPLNKRGKDFPSKEELIAELADATPCPLRAEEVTLPDMETPAP